MSVATFCAAMLPYAKQAATATGLRCELFLTQWGLESNWGQSIIAVDDHNFAGIECPSAGKGCTGCDGIYTRCPTTADFADLYIAILSDSTYAPVRATAGQSLTSQFEALGRSPWAESHYATGCGYDGCELVNLYNDEAATISAACAGTGPPPPPPGSGVGVGLLVAVGVLAAAAVWTRRERVAAVVTTRAVDRRGRGFR
jgi:hypothetical protein